MDVTFLLLFFISIFALAIGIISPGAVIIWGDPERRTRMAVCSFFGQAAILSITLYGLIVNVPDINFDLTPNNAAAMSAFGVTPAGQGTDETSIILLAPQPDFSVPQVEGYQQYDWSNRDFGVINDFFEESGGFVTIQGKALAFNRDYTFVRIDYDIYTSDGSKTGQAFASTTNLKKGTIWHFHAQGTSAAGKGCTCRVGSLSAW